MGIILPLRYTLKQNISRRVVLKGRAIVDHHRDISPVINQDFLGFGKDSKNAEHQKIMENPFQNQGNPDHFFSQARAFVISGQVMPRPRS